MNQPREIYVPPGGPGGTPPGQHLYELLGEEAIRKLLRIFYQKLSKSTIAHLFPAEPEELEAAAMRSADFFIQIMGGPPHFSTQYGPPRMRARHLRFIIRESDQKVWLQLFLESLNELPFPEEEQAAFIDFLTGFSAWMVNTRQD